MDIAEHRDAVVALPSEEYMSAGRNVVCGGAGTPCGLFSKTNTKENSASVWKLWCGVIMCAIFMVVEVVGGVKAHSLEILNDALHLSSDMTAFGFRCFLFGLRDGKPTPDKRMGFSGLRFLDSCYPYI